MAANVAQSADSRSLTVRTMLQKHSGSLSRLLGHILTPERYLTIAAHLYKQGSLQDVPPEDFCLAVMRMACLGLDPDPSLGHVYLLPFRDKTRGQNARQLEVVIGYLGRKELAYRSGFYSQIYANVIYEDEADDPSVFRAVRGSVSEFRHERPLSYNHQQSKGVMKEIVGAYSIAHLKSDPTKAAAWVTVPIHEIHLEHRDRSPSFKSGTGSSPWRTDYAAMCRKTAVHVLSADLRQTPQGAIAARIDGMHPDSIEVDFEQVAETVERADSESGKSRATTTGKPKAKRPPPAETLPALVELSNEEAAGIEDFLAARYAVRKGDPTALKRFLTQTWEDTKEALLSEAANWTPSEAPKDSKGSKADKKDGSNPKQTRFC